MINPNTAFAFAFIGRQRRLLEQQIEELHSCKMKVQEQKIAEGEEDEEMLNCLKMVSGLYYIL